MVTEGADWWGDSVMGDFSRARKRWVRTVVLVCVSLVGWGLVQPQARALPPYPSPPPDFSHPGSFHNTSWGANDQVYSLTGGQRDREMLVVLPRFSDVANTPGADENWAANRFFGGFPSVANWFNAMSGGDLILTAAAETDGTANNGVVIVNAGTFQSFEGLNDSQRSRRVLELANASVNFATFDDNNDGRIDDLELTVVSVRTGNPIADNPDTPANEANADNCGATRVSEGASYDSKTLTGISVSLNTTLTNLMTLVHEVGHQTTHMRDLYGFGVGAWALSGPTCGPPDTTLFGPNGFEKVHFGWGTPNVVVQDGYYDVANAATGAQPYYILYDPSKGTEDYFVVENRQATPNTYERSVHDSGLAIWRADDSVWESASDTTRPIEIMRPNGSTTPGCNANGICYGGDPADAWNPCDTTSSQRTMSRPWRDGTASRLAVRAIGCSASTIRAYFDVRGPGVLVDSTDAKAAPRRVDVVPTEASPVSFAVMNTGEATDTFDFTVEGLPAGWTASTDRKTLTAGAGSTANITVTPPADAPETTINLNVVGRSTTAAGISSTSPIQLRVVLHETRLEYTGAVSQPWGEGAGFAATVQDADNALAPIAGAEVTFRLQGSADAQEATAITDASGVATANPAITLPPGDYQLSVSVKRLGKHAGAALLTDYTVERRPTAIDYTGDATAEYSDPAAVSAVLTDGISGTPLAGKPIGFALGTQSASATTDATGYAVSSIVVNQPAISTTAGATFAGDTGYLASSDSTAFVIDEEDLNLVYTGDTLVPRGTTPRLAAQATQEDDGSPGNFTLAQVQFDLTPTLSTTPYRFQATANASGAATTPATGLPVDLWKVKPSIPATNGYWEGSGNEVELVHYDERAKVTGLGLLGRDSAGRQTQLTVTGGYSGGRPVGVTEFLSSEGLFVGLHDDWIVRVGNQAIVQAQGNLALNTPATLRLHLADLGPILTRRDWFNATMTSERGTYTSGRVTPTLGDLWIR
ncbi:M6 family metalloprotease-like protein [Kribbella sp. VKM Ac-2527]|uniref:M6 family metalloprotease-like protein n=1 Tax=Kribbella caucasensis TaxID=2512215 RepID=A0A4R6K447_9ACTN|nr:M6 family metalloprotease-like protein [Kribbella sp. VKM Ac-2527]